MRSILGCAGGSAWCAATRSKAPKELTPCIRKHLDDAKDTVAGSAKEAPRSLRVAKGTLCAHAPREVFALELRWRAVLGESFAVEEQGHEEHRARWEAEHADEARAAGEGHGAGGAGAGGGGEGREAGEGAEEGRGVSDGVGLAVVKDAWRCGDEL